MPVRLDARRALASALTLLTGTLFACAPAIDAQLDEAQALVAEGRPMAALPLLENVVQRRPEDGPANLLLGQVLLQVGRSRAAFVPLQRALESERWAVPAGLLLASAHLREGQPRPALAAVNQILATHPDQPAALRIRATAHLQIGAEEEALADVRHILEVAPDDTQAPILAGTALTRLGRLDEAETMLSGLESEAREQGPTSRHAAACVALASFLEVGRRDSARAGVVWHDCLERHPSDPMVLQGASSFFDQRGDPEASLAALRRALEHDPTALGVRLALAQRLAARGEVAEGEQLLVEAAESASGAPSSAGAGLRAAIAWQAVANFRKRHGDAEGARAALDRAIAAAAPEEADTLRFQRAILLLELGRVDEARAAEQEIATPALEDLLEGRLRLADGDADGALDSFESSIRRSPGDPRAHDWIGIAAQSLGRIDRALEAWARALTLDPTATDAGLSAARLAQHLGDHNGAVELLRRHRGARGTSPRETTLLEARSISALGQDAFAAALLESLLQRQSDPEVMALLSDVLHRSQGPEAAAARIERARAAGLDLASPGALPLLRAYGLHTATAGRPADGLAEIERALAQHPDSVALFVVKASAQAAAEDDDGAEGTLRAAVALAPDDPGALANLGAWLHAHGDDDEALTLLLRAHELAPKEIESGHLAAKLLAARGDTDGAERLLRQGLAANPLHPAACNDLAWLLAGAGRDLDLALELARRAVRLQPSGATLDTLGWVQLVRGDNDAAREALSQAVARDPANPGFRYRLGLAYARSGREAEARAAFEEALTGGPFPEAELARAELARIDG